MNKHMELILELRVKVLCEDRELTPEQVVEDLSWSMDFNTIAAGIEDVEIEDYEVVAGRG